MSKRIKVLFAIAVLAATWVVRGNAAEGNQTLPKPPDKQMLRAEEVKQLLLLIDTDESGSISKQKWLMFMEAEFDRLDPGKTGAIDPKRLALTNAQIGHTRFIDLGK